MSCAWWRDSGRRLPRAVCGEGARGSHPCMRTAASAPHRGPAHRRTHWGLGRCPGLRPPAVGSPAPDSGSVWPCSGKSFGQITLLGPDWQNSGFSRMGPNCFWVDALAHLPQSPSWSRHENDHPACMKSRPSYWRYFSGIPHRWWHKAPYPTPECSWWLSTDASAKLHMTLTTVLRASSGLRYSATESNGHSHYCWLQDGSYC